MDKIVAELENLNLDTYLDNCTINSLRCKLQSLKVLCDQYTDIEALLRFKEDRIRELERENLELRRKYEIGKK